MNEDAATRRIRLRYAGTCATCGVELGKGEWGIYDKVARTVSCPEHTAAPVPFERANASPVPAAAGPLDALVPKRLRRDGVCALCASTIPQGADAWWNPGAKTFVCAPCRNGAASPVIGTAGASATKIHERNQSKVQAELVRDHPLLGRLALKFRDDIPDSWSRGAIGEQVVGEALNAIAGESCIVLHDRKIPGSQANIDHIAVAASGIWVIDAKRYWDQRPEIRDRGGWLNSDKRLYVGGRDRTNLIEGLDRQLAAVVKALGPLLAEHAPPTNAALAFVDADWGWRPPSELRGVRITGPRELPRLVQAGGPLDATQISALATTLALNLHPTTTPA